MGWRRITLLVGLLVLPIGILALRAWGNPGAWSAVLAFALTGWEGGIPQSLATNHTIVETMVLAWSVDFIGVLIVLPIASGLFRHLTTRFGFTRYLSIRLERTTQNQSKRIRKAGPFGLVLYMLIPFITNGPFLAALLGRILRLKIWVVYTTIFVTNAVLAVVWVLVYSGILGFVEFSTGLELPILRTIIISVIVAILGAGLWKLILEYRQYLRSPDAFEQEAEGSPKS